jgi:TetR/AcrR family transcriptional regulator, cholesterol catabolism regulator
MRPYDERFTALLTHAARVFAGRGYDRTSMRDLAAASGMSLAGIYYYVRGKEDLLYHIQERCFTQVVEGAEAALHAAVDPEERLASFIKHHVTFFADHMPEMKVLSHEAQALSGERLRKVNQIKRRYVNLLERLLKDVAPERPPLERSAATYALFGMMNWIYNWYDPAGALDSGHLADLLTRIFLGGFAEARSPVTGGS